MEGKETARVLAERKSRCANSWSLQSNRFFLAALPGHSLLW